MRKIITIIAISFVFISLGFSQTTLFEDDFESLTVGDFVSSSPDWDTWSGSTGGGDDAVISDDYNHTASGANSLKIVTDDDIVYYFGDQTTGAFQVKFWYYIPTGQGGYFNVQHDFGTNWALSVEMADGGSGTLTYDNPSQTVAFTFPQDTWFEIIMDIDLEADQVGLNINSTEVATWQFSLSESTGGPMLKLDCINFYGYPDITPPYYVDDFEYIQTFAPIEHPELDLSNTSFDVDGLTNQTLTLTNSGEEEMTFDALVYYPSADKGYVKGSNNDVNRFKKVVLNSMEVEKMDKPIKIDLNSKDETLTHLTGSTTNSLGWGGTSNTDAKATALFKYDNNNTSGVDIKDYIGMELSNVIIYCNDLPVSGSTQVEIYEGRDGVTNGPMNTAITTEGFTPVEAGQVTVSLTTPVFISGKDLFIGWAFTQLPSTHCVPMDDGAPTAGANWTNTGVAWSEVSEVTFGNFGIVGNLTGTPIHQWLTLDVTTGTVTANGGTQDIILQFDITGMATGEYSSSVVIKTNDDDDDEAYNEIPVTLDVVSSIENINSGIMTFPNPVTDIFTIVSDSKINHVKVTDLLGRLIQEVTPNSNTYKFDLSNLSKGVYIFDINTVNHTISRKIIVE